MSSVPSDQEWRGRWSSLPRRTRWQMYRTIRRGEAMRDPELAAVAVQAARERSQAGGRQTIYGVMAIAWGTVFLLTVIVVAFGHGGHILSLLVMSGANLMLNAWMYRRWPEWTERAGVAVDANTLRATQAEG